MIDLADPAYGVLSQNCGQHPPHLAAADRAALNQADHHPHMVHDQRIFFGRAGFGRGRRCSSRRPFAISPLIERDLLLLLHVGVTVVVNTAPSGLLLAVGLPATEGTTHFIALPDIARMSQKENAAMPAPGQAGTQLRLGPQNRSQQPIILKHQGRYGPLAIPVRPKLKMLCDRDCKKPKLPLKMLRLNLMSPSYRNGSRESRK